MDIFNNIGFVKALDAQTISTDTTTVGNTIDLSVFGGDVALIFAGEVTAGDMTPALFHADSSDMSDEVAIEDSIIKPVIIDKVKYETGQEALAKISSTQELSKLGLKKDQLKRYFRVKMVSDNSANIVGDVKMAQEALIKSTQGVVADEY